MIENLTPEQAMRLRAEELGINPSPRVAVALCLDVSLSMSGEPLAELNRGVQEFYRACQQHPQSSQSAEVAVIAFGSNARLVADFCGIGNTTAPSLTTTEGSTNLTAGIKLALEKLDSVKAQYQQMGVLYYQPWIVIMTDGAPDDQSYRPYADAIVNLEGAKKLIVFPIGIGAHADMSVLSHFSGKRTPLRIQGLNFSEFFEWLSQSIAKVSESRPGDTVKLDVEGMRGWAVL